MNLKRKVTVFVTLILSIWTVLAHAQDDAGDGLSLSARMGGYQTAAQDSKAHATVTTGAEYDFWKDYALGASFYYSRLAKEFGQAGGGFGDVWVYLADGNVWSRPQWGTSLSFKLGGIAPVSKDSRDASLLWGVSQSAVLTQKFTDRLSLLYGLFVGEYGYEYDTVKPDDPEDPPTYNVDYKFVNKVGLVFKPRKWWRMEADGWALTMHDLDIQVTTLFGLGGSMGFNIGDYASIDFGVSSSYKQPGQTDPNFSDSYSETPFGRDGVTFAFGTTIKI